MATATATRRGTPRGGKRSPKAPAGFVATLAALGALFEVSTPVLYEWKARGCPVKKIMGKGYATEPVRAWRAAREEQKAVDAARAPGDEARLLKAQADEREAKAALADLRLKIERGEYWPVQKVKERDQARILAVKSGLLSLPKALGPLVAGMRPLEAEVAIEGRVRDLLRKFSEM